MQLNIKLIFINFKRDNINVILNIINMMLINNVYKCQKTL